MRCERCGVDNRAGRRFCADCGAILPRVCPNCSFINQPEDRFCGGCGNALEASQPAIASSPDNVRIDRSVQDFGERRQVTILFADLSGYTALAAGRDPEETHRILGQFFEAVDGAVTRYGGAVERHIGDNVMGVFGAPVAHDDDPIRAVRAAADIHKAVIAVGAELHVSLSVHVGIAAGTVMASVTGSTLKASYGVVGSPVNLASRLQGRASPGETLVSDQVKIAVENVAEVEALGAVEMKGLDEPVLVWRIKGELRGVKTQLPLVGRQGEVRLLTSLLDAVDGSGRGSVVHIRGQAGIGKTRLLQVLSEEAHFRGYATHTALVLDFGAGQGRDATRSLVASLLRLTHGDTDDARRGAIMRAIAEGIVAGEDIVFLTDLLDLRQEPEHRTLYDAMGSSARRLGKQRAFANLLRGLSARSSILLIVEDLHWAEPAILDDLGALTDAVSAHPIILTMTSRIDGDPIDDAFRGRVNVGITTIDLGPLRPEEASEFAQRLRSANDDLLKRCVTRAEGNPLFLEQLLRNSEEGAAEDEVPASVQSLVLARMDRLDARDKIALQAASINGQRFSIEFVRNLTQDLTYVPDALLSNQMIRREGAEFLFAHALVRDGVYSSLTHNRRKALHRLAANWLSDRDAGLRAEHLEHADDPGAASAYQLAAQTQALACRYDLAISLAERGRAIAMTRSDQFALDLLRGDLLREMGRATELQIAFQTALSQADTPIQKSRAYIGLAAANRVLSQSDPTLSALALAQAAAEPEGAVIERAQVHYYRGNIRFAQGDATSCLAEHEAALAIANECNDPEWRARALSGIGDARYLLCKMRTALDAFQECVGLCDQLGFGRVALPNRIMIGHCMVYLQRTSEAISCIEEAREIARRTGNPHAQMFATQSLGVVTVLSGQFDQAAGYMTTALDQARALGARRYEASIVSHLAECAFRDNRHADSLQLALEAVAISRQIGMGFVGPYSLAVLARATSDPFEKERALAEGEAILRAGCVGHNWIWFYRVAADTQIDAANWLEARRYANELLVATSSEPLPLAEFIAAQINERCEDRRH